MWPKATRASSEPGEPAAEPEAGPDEAPVNAPVTRINNETFFLKRN